MTPRTVLSAGLVLLATMGIATVPSAAADGQDWCNGVVEVDLASGPGPLQDQSSDGCQTRRTDAGGEDHDHCRVWVDLGSPSHCFVGA